jgi:hypothetical protein
VQVTDQAAVAADMGQGGHGQQRGSTPAGVAKGRRSNWRTALVLLSIALVFFAGVIVNRLLFN